MKHLLHSDYFMLTQWSFNSQKMNKLIHTTKVFVSRFESQMVPYQVLKSVLHFWIILTTFFWKVVFDLKKPIMISKSYVNIEISR